MTIESMWRSRISLSSNQPSRTMVSISVSLVITRHYVQKDEVLDTRFGVKIGETASNCWEHSTAGTSDDHFSTEFTELIPKVFIVQGALY